MEACITAGRSVDMRNEDGGLFVGPGDGEALPNPIGGRMVVKIRDEDTVGAYSIHDNTIPPGSPGPRPHIHRHHEEAFYVLEGELTVRVGQRKITAPAGSFVVVPRGVVHQPSNPGTQPTRVLLIFSPAGMDGFFEEAAQGRMPLQAEPTDPAVQEKLAAFTRKYGYEFAEFPTGP
jgi:quercetin dioxygenase-like cupin family protein